MEESKWTFTSFEMNVIAFLFIQDLNVQVNKTKGL